MTNETLTRELFVEMTDAHGADLSRWPLHLVKPALALMEQDRALQALFDRARALDDVLRRADADMDARIRARHGEDAAALQARIMAAIHDAPVQQAPVAVVAAAQKTAAPAWSLGRLFAPAGGGLLMLGVLGFLIGFQPAASADDMLLSGPEIAIAGDSVLLAAGEW